MSPAKDIILFHYPFSPYARRVIWYLNLRGIPYSQCVQPPIMPRPDVAAIGTVYRRIPILSIGRDIYNDTRLILAKLEKLYPEARQISASSPDQKALERLLEYWAIDSGIFMRATNLIPSNPLTDDPKFQKDRSDFSGRTWSKSSLDKTRPEALVEIKAGFAFLETLMLADGREWILKTSGPSLADIEAVWVFHWLTTMKGALPTDQISPNHFPKTFAWISRFGKAVKATAGKPRTINGQEALSQVEKSDYAEDESEVDAHDPTGLKKGEEVEVWPIDSGVNYRDRGRLVGLDGNEVVIESETKGGERVRVHTPRHGFRVMRVQRGSNL